MSTTRRNMNPSRVGSGLARWVGRIRIGLLGAVEEESALATEEAEHEETKDIFDRLPEPVHLDHGDVKYTDGKLRFLD